MSASPPAPARSSGWPGWKARAFRRCSACCSGRDGRSSGAATYPDGRGLPKKPDGGGAARRLPGSGRPAAPRPDARQKHPLQHQPGGLRRARGGLAWYGRRRARARAERQIDNLRIRARRADTLANQLSGGNQQKVVIGKWLEIGPRVFLLDDPTRGVDVGAKREIYALIREMSAEGGIVLFSSTELPELIGLCDRILVLYRGRLAGELAGTGHRQPGAPAPHQHRRDAAAGQLRAVEAGPA